MLQFRVLRKRALRQTIERLREALERCPGGDAAACKQQAAAAAECSSQLDAPSHTEL